MGKKRGAFVVISFSYIVQYYFNEICMWGHIHLIGYFHMHQKPRSQLSVAKKGNQLELFLQTHLFFRLQAHTHAQCERERADSVLSDHPDINDLSYSRPFCQPTVDGEPHESFQ